jgi:hypothetical protein
MEPDREAWHVLADEIAAMLADLITHREDRIQEDHNRETARGYSPGRFQVGRQKGYCRALALILGHTFGMSLSGELEEILTAPLIG